MNSLNRHFLVALVVLLAAQAGCYLSLGPGIQGSGVEKTETRSVGSFTEIEVGNAIELEVTIGPAAELVVTGDDNILPLLKTDVSGDRLRIYVNQNYSSQRGVKVLVAVPELRELAGSGAARISVAGVESDKFLLDLSGASSCQFTGKAERIDVKLSGASRATLDGSATHLSVQCSGASRLTANEFTADKVEAEVNGASTAHVHADKELDAEASGASTVRYSGEPSQVREETSGASHVDRE